VVEVVAVSLNRNYKRLNNYCVLERVSRPDTGPPEPYRSQSMAILPEKFHQENKENNTTNNLPSSSDRKPSSDQQRKSTSRSSAGRARSTRPFRAPIRSAVPDSSVITIAKRPDRGGTGILFFLRKKQTNKHSFCI
jgi:hypothetical protein